VAGPGWSDDHPGDQGRIVANCGGLLADIRAAAQARHTPTAEETKRWHAAMFQGCVLPAAAYVGNFRGAPQHRDLIDYEVGVGPTLADGYPERVGVWAADVAAELDLFFDRLQNAFAALDRHLAPGAHPTTVDLLQEAVALTAVVHGEWIRIHPFANGNGRTARLWAAYVSLRYGLPVYVALKPRPGDVAYARAAKASMGRPPGFAGNHRESIAVFAHLLTLALLPP
jgi:fido (protein-threonine AMPylation protein)